MDITQRQEGSRIVLDVNGHIDEEGAEILKTHFHRLDLTAVKEVDIDMRRVSHIGSSGIGKLLLFYKHLAVKGGALRVTGLAPHLYDLFIELKLDSLFTIQKT